MRRNNRDFEAVKINLLFNNGECFRSFAPNVAIGILKNLLSDKNPEVRMRALEKMRDYSGRRVVSALKYSLRHDGNQLVKIAAIEGMRGLQRGGFAPELQVAMSDKTPMVRGYAAIALGELSGWTALSYISKALSSERSTWARAALRIAAYIAGADSDLREILLLLKSRQYRVRSFVVNNLESLCSRENRQIIRLALQRQLKIESSKAVRSSIKRVLKAMRGL